MEANWTSGLCIESGRVEWKCIGRRCGEVLEAEAEEDEAAADAGTFDEFCSAALLAASMSSGSVGTHVLALGSVSDGILCPCALMVVDFGVCCSASLPVVESSRSPWNRGRTIGESPDWCDDVEKLPNERGTTSDGSRADGVAGAGMVDPESAGAAAVLSPPRWRRTC